MIIARLLTKIYKNSGIILVDHTGKKYICGNPDKTNPIVLKLLKKNLSLKLFINPELEFPEAYMRGDLIIENASLSQFLDLTFKNIGRKEVTPASYVVKNFLHAWRYISNYFSRRSS